VFKVLLERRELLVLKERKVDRALKDPQALKVLLERRELLVLKERKVDRALKESKEQLVLDLLVHKVFKDQLDLLAHKVFKVHLVLVV
jgi:hypothetical protein